MSVTLRKLRSLDRLVSPAANTILHVYDTTDGKDKYILAGDLLSGNGYGDWSSAVTYDTGDRVTYGFRLWESLIDTNENIIPTEGANWTEVSPTALPSLASVLTESNDGGGLQIKNIADPTDAQDVDTKAARDAAIAAAVIGLWDDRGNFDASVDDMFPAAGGSGAAGVILKGDIWTVSVAGTIDGEVVQVGDTVRAIADAPGQDGSNWAIGENNIGYVPENTTNKATDFSTVNNTLYPTTQAVVNYVASVAGSSKFNALIAADNTNTINNTNYTQEWQWNTLSGSGLKLTSNSTAAAANAQKLFEVALSGANVTSTQTTYAAYISNTHTGTSSTNIGGYFTASGGTTNYAIQTGGDVFVIGSGSTSATNSLTVQNSAGRNMLSIRNDGFITFGSTLTPISLAIGKTTSYFSSTTSTSGFTLFTPTNVSDASLTVSGFNTYNHTSGTGKALSLNGNFVPTSGTAAFYYLDIPVTINQTGGANGVVKFVSIYPTFTAANDVTGFDYNPSGTPSGTHLSFRATSGNFLLGGTSITSGSVLMDLQSSSRALLLTRISDDANLTTKVAGMHWYNSTDHKYRGYENSTLVTFLTKEAASGGKINVYDDNSSGYKLKHLVKPLSALSAATSGNADILSASEIANGESVTIVIHWTAKDDSSNTAAGGVCVSVWSKEAGTLNKVNDVNTANPSDTGDTLTVSTSDVSGVITATLGTGSVAGNFSCAWIAYITIRKS